LRQVGKEVKWKGVREMGEGKEEDMKDEEVG
jgi:hypothetical protein